MDPQTLFHKRIQQYQSIIPNLRTHVARNPHMTMEMVLQDIQNNPKYKHEWKFDYLCQSIPVDTLLSHGFIPDRPDLISSCLVNLTVDMLKKTKDTIQWSWSDIARHKDITIADIASHPDLPWSYLNGRGISNNPNLTHQDILNYPHLFTDYYRSVAYTNLSEKVSFEEIQNHFDKPWSISILANPNINTVEKVRYIFDKNILGTLFNGTHHNITTLQMYICMNPSLKLQDLLELFGTDILFYAPYNLSVNLEQLQQFPEELWNKLLYVMSHRVPIDYIMEHPEIKWDWPKIIRHNKIPYDKFQKIVPFIADYVRENLMYTPSEYNLKTMYFSNHYLSHVDRKRVYEDLLRLAIEPLSDGIGVRYHCDFLIRSPLFLEPTFQEMKEYFAKKRIVRLLTEVHANPSYKQCHKRLSREFKELPCKKTRY
jgi:hypothetical protein